MSSRGEKQTITQVVPSKYAVSTAPELFAQQLALAPKGHKYYGWSLWTLPGRKTVHYYLYDEERLRNGKGLEVLPSKMQEFAEAENYFTSAGDTEEYKKRKIAWREVAKPSNE